MLGQCNSLLIRSCQWYNSVISSPFIPPIKKLFSLSRKERFLLYLVIALVYGIYSSFFTQNDSGSTASVPDMPFDTTSRIPQQMEKPAGPTSADLYLVTKIVDGDTIEVAELDADGNATKAKHAVRYIGIDTPETVAPGKPVQCYGEEASARNAELALNRYVRLEKDKSDTDRYGRWLRYAYLDADAGSQNNTATSTAAQSDEIFINMILVREGYAHAHAYAPDIAHKADFASAETEAKSEKAGLWGACN